MPNGVGLIAHWEPEGLGPGEAGEPGTEQPRTSGNEARVGGWGRALPSRLEAGPQMAKVQTVGAPGFVGALSLKSIR